MDKKINVVVCFIGAVLVLTSTLFSARLLADESKVYFIGKLAPMGASSQVGKNGKAIYLRWDLIEGQFPVDVKRLVLKKKGTLLPLLERDIDEVMTSEEIKNIYAGEAESQRLLNTITLLKQYSLADAAEFNGNDFNASEFASKLISLFESTEDFGWTTLASRINFNIARARFRAYLDLDVTGTDSYTLEAISLEGKSTLIGQVSLEGSVQSQLMPVSNFRQVPNESCNAADSMKDHSTVVLDWDAAGTGENDKSITDMTANAIQLTGYHLYRTTKNLATGVDTPPVIDLASLAATANHDQQGSVSFLNSGIYDLERVNNYILITEGKKSHKQELDESVLDESILLDPDTAFFETPQQLSMAGLKPGDKRAYYIVPIDFAGHMGETRAAIIHVPDKVRPATPWDVNFKIKGTAQPKAQLQWDESTLVNYTARFAESRVICNEENGLVAYAIDQASCAQPVHTRLDVDQYLVYRFSSSDQALSFVDADGDGISDADEQATNSQCDSEVTSGGKNYLIASDGYEVIQLDNQRSRMSFSDTHLLQTTNIGKKFWYRLASKTNDGRVSFLTGPIKGVYHDIFTLPKPEITANIVGNCCEVESIGEEGGKEDWSFIDQIGQYDTLSLNISNSIFAPVEGFQLSAFADPQSDLCNLDSSPIKSFWNHTDNRVLIYPGISVDSAERPYCEVTLPHEMNLCKKGAWQLVEKSCNKPLTDGEMVDQDSLILYTISSSEPGSCINVMQDIDGSDTRLASSCGNANPGFLEFEVKPGFCGHAVAQDASGNTSPWAALPCSQASSVNPPNPPQIISFNANAETAEYSWRLPLEPVAVTLIELTSNASPTIDESDKQLISVPNAGFSPARVFENQSTNIHLLSSVRDQWCIRMKSIAPVASGASNPLSSQWSNKICQVRRENGVVSTEYLPWPRQANLVVKNNLAVRMASNFVNDSLGMPYEKMPIMIDFNIRTLDQNHCAIHNKPENWSAHDPHGLLFGRELVCDSIDAVVLAKIIGDTSFVLYRQGETSSGERGDWVQVSPLIDTIHWQSFIGSKGQQWKFDDPYFLYFRTDYAETQWSLSFIDRYPYNAGYKYRYQMVTFSEQHAIKSIRQSPWVQTEGLTEIATGVNQ